MDRRRRGKRDRIVAMRSTFLLSKSGYSSQVADLRLTRFCAMSWTSERGSMG